jgi:hypothetical protein
MLTWSIVVGVCFFLFGSGSPPKGVNLGLNTRVYSGTVYILFQTVCCRIGLNKILCVTDLFVVCFVSSVIRIQIHTIIWAAKRNTYRTWDLN